MTGRPIVVELEMAVDRAEFLRTLARGLRTADLTLSGESFIAEEPGGRRIEVRFQALPPRRIGMLALPRARVSFAFEGHGDDEVAARMACYRRHTQRGGG